MSERGLPIADGAAACPFVAFEDDRDERATVPDHRHRCYADARPTPRALAHQEAYCLSSSFPVCPTFQDWARRESARARADAKAREDADVADRAAASMASSAAAGGEADAGFAVAGASEGAGHPVDGAADTTDRDLSSGRPSGDGDMDVTDDEDGAEARRRYDEDEPRRNPPRDWSAPPPWLASNEASGGAARNAPPPEFLARRAGEPGQGLAGSAADRLAGGPPRPPPTTAAGRIEPRQPFDEPPPDIEEVDDSGAPLPRRPRAYDQHLGGPSNGPDWERPRRYEAYPTIKTRVGMPAIPRLVVLAALIALAALVFFFLPAILGLGRDGAPSGGSPSQSAAAPSVSFESSLTPVASPTLYTIKKGETLSKIATAHGITIEQLLAANPTIKNPDKITEGQEITIPTPEQTFPDEFGPSGSPAESP